VCTGEILATRNYLAHWKETLTYFKYMLTKTPGNSPMHFKISEELLKKGRYKESEEHYWKGIKKEPSIFYNDYGTTLAQSGKIDEAIVFFRKSIEFKHDFAVAHYNLAIALEIKGDKVGAILEYQEALKHKKDHVQSYNNLGGIYMEQKKYDEAIAMFEQATHYDPNFFQAYNNVGMILSRKGKYDEAIIHFKKALDINPNYQSAQANLERALKLKEKQSTEPLKTPEP
jgi:tetratricopeptide (TPR) repeat protein